MPVILTPRERQVLFTYLEAGTTKETAAALGLSDQTVKNILVHARKRAGVRNTTQLVYRLLTETEP